MATTNGRRYKGEIRSIAERICDMADSGVSGADELFIESRSKPVTKEDAGALAFEDEGNHVGMYISPFVAVKEVSVRKGRPKHVVIVGVKGKF